MSGLSAGLATGTVILRDGLSTREAARLIDTSYRTTSASEVVLGWVLTLAYGTIGWWAALICATLVLVIWQAHDAREIARHDAMTGLLSRSGFDARLDGGPGRRPARRAVGRRCSPSTSTASRRSTTTTATRRRRRDPRGRRPPAAVDPADRCRRPARRRRVRRPARRRVRHGRGGDAGQAHPRRPVRARRDRARAVVRVGASIGVIIIEPTGTRVDLASTACTRSGRPRRCTWRSRPAAASGCGCRAIRPAASCRAYRAERGVSSGHADPDGRCPRRPPLRRRRRRRTADRPAPRGRRRPARVGRDGRAARRCRLPGHPLRRARLRPLDDRGRRVLAAGRPARRHGRPAASSGRPSSGTRAAGRSPSTPRSNHPSGSSRSSASAAGVGGYDGGETPRRSRSTRRTRRSTRPSRSMPRR